MKKMRNWNKLTALFLTLSMVVLSLAACGGKEQAAETNSNSREGTSKTESSTGETEDKGLAITYPLQTDETLSIAIYYESPWAATYDNFADTPYAKALQERTGVGIEYQTMADDSAMNLLFASGELPDIIQFNAGSYSGGAQKAIQDGIIYPLNDIIEANAPDMLAVLQSNEDYLKSSMTANGDYIGFPFIRGDKILRTSIGLMIRDDWCGELGIEIPETVDDFYEMLKLFKEKKGASVPLSTTMDRFNQMVNLGLITSGFGLPKASSYQKDGKVYFGFAQPEYKQVLEYLNKLYTEGLLDQNFSTLDSDTANANIMNGQSGVTVGALSGGLGNYLRTMEGKGEYSLAGIRSLVANKGDKPMCGHVDNAVMGIFGIITPNCKNKELAAQFLNYSYTEEGKLFYNFGIEGESYTMVDNKPVYTELITHNPDGLTMQQALSAYTRSWNIGWFVQDPEYIRQYAALPQQQAALKNWTDNDASSYLIPPVTINSDDASEYTTILSDINTYKDEMTVKYVMGVEPLSSFESKYIKTLKSMGIDRAAEIQQNAIEEYNSRK